MIVVQAMAFTRNSWIDKMRNSLSGALGEYAKLRFARVVGLEDYWSNEIKRLCIKPILLMDEKVKTKSNFNRQKALQEAISEVVLSQDQVTDAKNYVMGIVVSRCEKNNIVKLLKHTGFDVEDLLKDMFEEYLGDLN